jgi:hypothetical protein
MACLFFPTKKGGKITAFLLFVVSFTPGIMIPP